MQARVVEFANLLRKSGVRVSVAEAIDAFEALDELSLGEREIFKDALRTSMIKRGDEIATYDQLFDLFWSGFYDNLRQSFGDMDDALAESGINLEELLRQIAEQMGQMEGELDLSELVKALLTQDLSNLENLIREAAEAAGIDRIENMLQVGFFSRRTTEQLGVEGAAEQLENLLAQLEEGGMPSDQVEAMRELIQVEAPTAPPAG